MIDNLYQFREALRKQNVYFSFVGPFSQPMMENIVEALREKMRVENMATATILNVFGMVVELAQNIIYYSAETIPALPREGDLVFRIGALVIGYEGEHYFIVSGNMIDNRQVPKLRDRLTTLQQMTKEELKAYYKEQRRKQPDAESRGAGLGLIEMARKASQPIAFDFQPIDAQRSFFSIKTII